MLGNQVAVLKGAQRTRTPASCSIEFLLSEEGSDIFVEGEAVYSLRCGLHAASCCSCPVSAGPEQ